MEHRYILAVDFDGTLFSGQYPQTEEPKWDIINKVKEFKENGAEIILWTCRSKSRGLQEAVNKSREVGLEFHAVNDNTESLKKYMRETNKTFADKKIFATFYLDDRSDNLDLFLKMDVKKAIEKEVKKNS